jgi:hypothetical protein
MMKIFALMLACMMILLVSAVSYAEEASTDIFAMETPVAAPAQEVEEVPEEKAEEEEPAVEPEPVEEPAPAEVPIPADESADEEFDDDDLVEIEDDWGYVSRELIEQHTPEMTQEFIHADDPDWVPEGQEKAAPAEEPAEEQVQDPQTDEAPAVEEIPADVKEETEASAEESEATEETEALAEEIAEETAEEKTEEEKTEDEKPEEASKVTVKVTASMRDNNLMHLKAEVQDPEGKDYNYQWQVSVDGGDNYEDVEDAEEDFLDVELDEENMMNLWRVKVHAVG